MGLMPRVFLAAGALMLVQAAVTSGAWAQAQGMPTPSEPPGAGTSGQGYVPPGQSDFEKAEGMIKSGSYEDAIPLLMSIVRDNPNEPDSLYYLGFANEKILNYKTAFEFYARAVKADPDHKRAHEGLGLLFLKVGDLTRASSELEELRRICAVNCDERQRLATKITEYKDAHPAGAPQPAGKGKAKGKPQAAPAAKKPDDDLTTLP